MGVHGLWELLAPVGRRVSVETLAGKRLAIDASIWIVQFMKAMRDEKGEMVRNAHVLGFFRRICKLLLLRTKPVFVFDGGTPALKRRTVIARRRQRENAQSKIRKTAEKLLLNHLKQMRLKELAADLEKQRLENYNVKGKKPITEVPTSDKEKEKGISDTPVNYSQEELDEMLAASLAAEENEGFAHATTSDASRVKDDGFLGDEDEEEEDEELILPVMHGKVDPAVLASLPPSMQLDLLVQMRERLMAENRQKYQKVKKAPSRFSELQIESYLKTVAFRREIDGVQKAASGRGIIGGLQTSRIASEANREYIFSSSFTGDKQVLTAVGEERLEADQNRGPPNITSTNAFNVVLPSRRSGGATGSVVAETGKKAFHEDIETYTDERGRLRVSRGRALGIHMTRDIQRNLDLMKEIDQEKAGTSREKNNSESTGGKNLVDVLDDSSDLIYYQEEITDKNSDGVEKIGTSIEISFEDTLEMEKDNDDEIFARLVAGGDQSLNSTSDNEWEEGLVIGNKSLVEGSVSEVEWEEGIQDIEMKYPSCPEEIPKTVTKGVLEEEANIQEAIKRSLEEDTSFRISMNHCQEGDHVISNETRGMSEGKEEVSETEASAVDLIQKTVTEDDDDIQEAIRRSLEYTGGHRSMSNFEEDREMISENEDRVFVYEGKNEDEGPEIEASVSQPSSTNALELNSEELKSAEFVELNPGKNNLKILNEDASGTRYLAGKTLLTSNTRPEKQLLDTSSTAELGKTSVVDPIFDEDGANKSAKEDTSYDDFSAIVNDDMVPEMMMEGRLEQEMTFLGKEREYLGSEQRKLERNSESVSSEIFAECQELLQMFGLPYIIAPMEAEAQCAFMELSNLVDGVVTDDSDTFLFGAKSVYKNIFDDRKYVETYLMKDMENELGLDREKLIHMALLLGSDYTEGISGIGIVNAIEVVNAFPGKEGLREFREWIESPDPTILGKVNVESGGNSRRKGSKGSENINSGSSSNVEGDKHDGVERIKQIFMDKHRNVSKNWNFSSSFPSDAVISAYASPQVDKSTEPLAWGKPDLFILRKLCWEKFGWATSKADELLLPVLKEYNKHETQLRMEAFYTFNERFAKIRSKRIKKAVKGITKNKSSDIMDEATSQQPGSGKKRKDQSGRDGEGPTNEAMEKPAVQQLKRGRTKDKASEESNSVEGSCARGKRGGRGKRKMSGRGRKKISSCADGESHRDDVNSSRRDETIDVDESEESRQVRRSGRVRKTVNYNVSNEFDDFDKDSENHLKDISTAEEESFVGPTVGSFNQQGNDEENELDQMAEGTEGIDVGIGDRNYVEDPEKTYRTDNTSGNLVDDNQIDENLEDVRLSKEEYLQFGGGFCVDEDEEMETNEPYGLDIADSLVEQINPEGNPPVINTQRSSVEKEDVALTDTENDGSGSRSKSLRSMPNLRRKKKRN